jgi:putative aldouronate transport system substrate-binding protein
MYDYAEQGALLDLAPYLEEYLPHVLEIIPEDVLDKMKVDGKLYGIPIYCSPNRMNCMIRQDWLDNLGLAVPTTLTELHDVLTAFTRDDPDGNGKADTVGMTGRGLDGLEPIFGAFGFTGVAYSYWYEDAEGNLKPSALHENAPAALKLLKQWYSEGIIDPEIFTLTTEAEINEKAYNNYWGYYYNWWTYDSKLEKTIHEYDENFDLVTLAPPSSDLSIGYVRGVNSTNGVVCVMADTPHLEDCLKLLDWYHTEDGMMTAYSGVQGLHWYQDDAGKYYPTPQCDTDAKWIQWYSAFESEWPLLQVETYMVQSRRDEFNWNTLKDASDMLSTDAELMY